MTRDMSKKLSSLARTSEDELRRLRMKRRLFRPEGDRGSHGPYDEPWGPFIESLQLSLELHLEDLHTKVIRECERMKWDGAALYSIDSGGYRLEAVAATDATVPGVVRHRLPSNGKREWLAACDIEVCTYVAQRAELLGSGYDLRYNPYVYEVQGHDRFKSRLFIPLILILDREDLSMRQERCTWTREGNVWSPAAPGCQLYSVGTLSVSSEDEASDSLIEGTLEFATRCAAPLTYRASLQGLCRSILGVLLQASGADEAALHLARDAQSIFSTKPRSLLFRSGAGVSMEHPTDGRVGAAPRPMGLGAEAMRRGLPLRFSGTELERRNEKLVREGFSATEVFPLTGAEGRCVGLLYLHYRDPEGSLSRGLVDLVSAASHEIDAALRTQQRRLLREHVLSEALRLADIAQSNDRARLWAMANFAWNLLGCDHVAIVLGDERTPALGRVVEHAGRSLESVRLAADARRQARTVDETLCDELRRMRIPARPAFVEERAAASLYARGTFAEREKISATAVVPLKLDPEQEDVVGLLVVDYRGTGHVFDAAERELLERLSSFFAAGILVAQEPDAAHVRARYRTLLLRAAEKLQQQQEACELCPIVPVAMC